MPATGKTRTRKTTVPRRAVPSLSRRIAPHNVITELEKHILVDGFKLVIDLKKSRGSRLVDAPTGREIIALYRFFVSMPVSSNHPWFSRP